MTVKADIASGSDSLERELSWMQLLLYKVSFLKVMCCFKAVWKTKSTKAQFQAMRKYTYFCSLHSEDG